MSVISDFVLDNSELPDQRAVDELLSCAIAQSRGDWETVARTLAYGCEVLRNREELAVAIAEHFALPKAKNRRGRPRKRPRAGLQVLKRKRGKIGAPKKHRLPYSTKHHAIEASDLMDLQPESVSNARQAAILEFFRYGEVPTEQEISNLQKRISEFRRQK